MRGLAMLLVCLAVPSAAAQQGRWHLLPPASDTGATDEPRLALTGTDRPFWPNARHGGDTSSAALVVACGRALPGHLGRTLYFQPAQPLEPFGDAGYAHLRFDEEDWQETTYLDLDGHSRALQAITRREGSLRIGFLGDDASPYYSSHLMRHLLESHYLTVTYRAFGEERRVTFDLTGLSAALARLGSCDWRR
ncbi:MAG TPA: hypothetical protein VMG41_02060 [Gemmatimonadales bacterium]|nr:hypothetical protein [Gemmatimonadales bacterium]